MTNNNGQNNAQGLAQGTAHTIKVKTVENPKFGAGNAIGMTFGALFLVISVLMVLSIFLMIPGFFGILVGAGIMIVSVPKASVECHACGSTCKAKMSEKAAKCTSCQTGNPIRWVDAKKAAKE